MDAGSGSGSEAVAVGDAPVTDIVVTDEVVEEVVVVESCTASVAADSVRSDVPGSLATTFACRADEEDEDWESCEVAAAEPGLESLPRSWTAEPSAGELSGADGTSAVVVSVSATELVGARLSDAPVLESVMISVPRRFFSALASSDWDERVSGRGDLVAAVNADPDGGVAAALVADILPT